MRSSAQRLRRQLRATASLTQRAVALTARVCAAESTKSARNRRVAIKRLLVSCTPELGRVRGLLTLVVSKQLERVLVYHSENHDRARK